jgi:hypothetical protein
MKQFITLEEWLELFETTVSTEYNSFIKNAMVRRANDAIVSLNEYMTERNIPPFKICILYKLLVINKKKYLTNFFNKSVKVPESLEMGEPSLKYSNVENQKYKNIIRNLYFEEIMKNTGTIHKNIRPYMEVIMELFKFHIIDYKLLTPSVLGCITDGKFGSMLSAIYFRASIMNPYLVYSIAHDFKINKVLTPTLGWSSYLVGFLETNKIEHYVGIDVIPKVCETTKLLGQSISPDTIVDTYCSPSEKLAHDPLFMSKYKNYFDFIFFSPPYFQLELYQGENQSTSKYKTLDSWAKSYWEPTIRLCANCIEKHGVMCYIISNYKLNGKLINIVAKMNEITLNYFDFVKKLKISNSNVNITKHRETHETAFFFKRK